MGPVTLILGGLGPIASLDLHGRLLKQQEHRLKDSDYPNLIHFSPSKVVPDRTRYLLNRDVDNPGIVYGDLVKEHLDILCKQFSEIDIVVPCCTFHSGEIWNPFLSRLAISSAKIRVHNIVNLVAQEAEGHTKTGVVAYLATKGSYATRVWEEAFEERDIIIISPSHEDIALVHDIIYNEHFGLKSNSPDISVILRQLSQVIKRLRERNADTLILGCTELSLLYNELDVGLDILCPFEILSTFIFEKD